LQFVVQSISFWQVQAEKNKNHQKDFLSCLLGVEIIQENVCPTPPLLHTTNHLSSLMAAIKKHP